MADEEQLEILKQDDEDWNDWIKDNPNVKIDLTGANLMVADLRGDRPQWD